MFWVAAAGAQLRPDTTALPAAAPAPAAAEPAEAPAPKQASAPSQARAPSGPAALGATSDAGRPAGTVQADGSSSSRGPGTEAGWPGGVLQASGSIGSITEAGLQPASRQATAQAGSSGGDAAVRGDSGIALREASEHLQASAGSPPQAGSAAAGGPTSAEAGNWAGFGWGEEAGVGGACGDGNEALPRADAWPDSAGGGAACSAAVGAPDAASSIGQPSVTTPEPQSTAGADALPCGAPEWPAFGAEFDAPRGGAPAAPEPLQPSDAGPRPAVPAGSVPVAEDAAGSAAASREGLGGVVPADESMPRRGDAADAAGARSGMSNDSNAVGELASMLVSGEAMSKPPEGALHEQEPSDWGGAGDPLAALFPTTGLPSAPAALDRQSSWGSFGGAGSPGAGGAGPPADAWQAEGGSPADAWQVQGGPPADAWQDEGGSAEASAGGAGLAEGAGLQGMGGADPPLGARPEVVGEPLGGAPGVSGPPGLMGVEPYPDALLGDGGSCDAYWEASQDAREAGVNTTGNGQAGAVSAHVPTSQDGGSEARVAAGGAWGSAEGWGGGALAPGDGGTAVQGASDQRCAVAAGSVSGAERAVGGRAAAAGSRVSGRQRSQGLALQGAGSSNGGCHSAACAEHEGLAIPDLTFMLADALDERWVVREL